jgi:hypothetical protein
MIRRIDSEYKRLTIPDLVILSEGALACDPDLGKFGGDSVAVRSQDNRRTAHRLNATSRSRRALAA